MRRTKLQRLLATYERFGEAIADVPDAQVQELQRTSKCMASSVSALLARDDAPKLSQVASGLEQGLREMPDFIAVVSDQWRSTVAHTFYHAVSSEYPGFYERDSRRLDKILACGKIKTESEFYLVRYFVDHMEDNSSAQAKMQQLYSMLGAYELQT